MGILYLITAPNGKQYVGVTTQTLSRRWSGHCTSARRGARTHLHTAIRKHGPENFIIEAIDEADTEEELAALEVKGIADRGTFTDRTLGYNMTEGGEGITGHRHTEQTKAKMSETRMGHDTPDETRRKIAVSNTGKRHSQETRRKISEAKSGAEYSEEHMEKLQAGLKARWERDMTDAERETASQAQKDRFEKSPVSEETRARMSESGKKRAPISDTTRKRLSASRKGKKRSEETKRRISESLKAAHALRKAKKAAEKENA